MIFPQELVDVIVEDVHDRILLSCLTLSRESPWSFSAKRALLDESPHIATYITDLRVDVSQNRSTLVDIENLKQILKQLTNVHGCTLYATRTGIGLDKRFADAIPEFLMRQPLHRLCVADILEMQAPVFFRLMTTAPHIHLCAMSVGWPEPHEFSEISRSQISSLKDLAIGDRCPSATELLAQPAFAFYTAALTNLAISLPDYEGLMFSETITIAIGWNQLTIPPLPPLPALRRLRLRQNLHCFVPRLSRVVDTVTTFLTSSSGLVELLVLILVNAGGKREPDPRPEDLAEDLLLSLDDALMAHPASPSITWHFKSLEKSLTEDAVAPDFVAALQRDMPRMLEAGRLVFMECHTR
ncbi:hypothetical protein DFH06DRAFT_1477374 [Mycena polygramma]|nr:hypothetical protein DFH06DRAFT_1477374 [Mycena polygramma]